ncbi:MAG: hypothetical protein ACOYZ7_06565 [Chloroflexota bacterium]
MNTHKIPIAAATALLGLFITAALIAAPATPAQSPHDPPAGPQANGDAVAISKTIGVQLAIPGQPITYTIRYRIDPTTVTSVTLTDTLPLSTTWLADTATALGFSRAQTATQAVWNTSTLSAGSASFQLTLNVPADLNAPLLTNTVRLHAISGSVPLSHTFVLTVPVASQRLYLPLITRHYPTIELPPKIVVGAHPKSLAISEQHGRVYVTLFDDDGSGNPGGDGAVAAIDLYTHQVLSQTATGGLNPAGIAVISDTLYIANNGSNSLSVMNAVSLTLQQTVSVGAAPLGVAATAERIYVTNFDDDSLSIIDATTLDVITTVAVGADPLFPAAWGNCAYVPNHGDGAESITVVCDDGSEIYRLRQEWGYLAAAYTPNPNALWNPLILISRRDGAPGLYEISTMPPYGADKPVRKKDMTATPPFAVAYNPTTDHLLVVAADNDQLHIVYPGGYATGAVWSLPPQHEGPERLGGCGVAASGHWAWVANYADGSVSVLYDP